MQSHIDALKKALETQDGELIKSKTAALQQHMQKIGEELGKAGQGGNTPPPAGGQKPDIEDAEVEIDDKK